MTPKIRGPETAEQRFRAFVKTGPDCWEWTGAAAKGYGRFKWPDHRGKQIPATHVALMLEGIEVPKGMCALHRCDNPLCVRPSHLYVGSHADNARDRDGRGRGARGERHGMAKLTLPEVQKIRWRHARGESIRSLAEATGMSFTQTQRIIRRHIWKDDPQVYPEQYAILNDRRRRS